MRKKRNTKGRFLPVAAKRNPPRKSKRNPPARARRNPPAAAVKASISAGTAAIIGGLAAHALVKIADKIASPSVGSITRVVLPVALGFAATQLKHKHAQAIAAGAFGVAGAALATGIADAIVKPNPPSAADFWLDNPPALEAPSVDELTASFNAGYRDPISAMLRG